VAALLFAALLSTAAAAIADGPDSADRHHRKTHETEVGRVILPTAGPALSAAFASIEDHVPRFDAKLKRLTATGKACTAERCWDFQLSDPEKACHGAVLPAFCLVWRDDVPPLKVSVPVSEALQAVDPAQVWSAPPSRPPTPAQRLGIALALLLAPCLVGFVVGRLLRKLLPKHPGIRSLLALLLGVGAAVWGLDWALADRLHPSPSDVLVVSALLFGAAWIGGLRLNDPRIAKLAIGATVAGLVIAEIALTKSIPEPPVCWHGDEIKLLQPATRERVCRGAFATMGGRWFDRVVRRTAGGDEHVLHLGDSMVFGSGVGEHETFVAELDRRDAKRRHVNVSSPDIGPDHLLLTMRRWLKSGRKTKRVVLYVYPGNDLVDLDRPSPCCNGRPLLSYEEGKPPRGRCERLQWRPHGVVAVLKSAPPYPVRVMSKYSTTSAMACAAVRPVASAVGRISGLLPTDPAGGDSAWSHLGAILSAAAATGVPLDVVVLPERDGLEQPEGDDNPGYVRSRRVVKLCEKLGIRVHDAREVLERPVRREGSAPFFARTYARDYHLSARGHRLVADWLQGLLAIDKSPPAAKPAG